tara:strand:- start:822 stop:1865 length:1044 start_codon:yes stop_codon:yes gene_type:complete
MSKKNSIVLNRKNCFSKSERISKLFFDFKKKILNLRSNNFLVAVSGGPDSMALAALCKAFETYNKKKKFHYVHINHGIRKKSFSEAKQVKNILKKQSILLKIIHNKKKIIKNIQHNARKVRYLLLEKECKNKKIKFILTAHHKEDQIETFLIRLSRGSGVQGLSAMNSLASLNNNIKIFRPFLSNSKKELVFTSKKVFGTFIKDPSNKNKKFLRSGMRKLLPILKKYGIKEDQIIRSINNLKSSSQTINFYFKDIIKKIVKKKSNFFVINKRDLLSLNQELQLRVLSFVIKTIKKADYPPRSKKIFNVLKILSLTKNCNHQLGGCLIISNKNHVNIKKLGIRRFKQR